MTTTTSQKMDSASQMIDEGNLHAARLILSTVGLNDVADSARDIIRLRTLNRLSRGLA